jgi:hypothetical protein
MANIVGYFLELHREAERRPTPSIGCHPLNDQFSATTPNYPPRGHP